MKQFYSHLIEIESLIIELDKMDLSTVEKHHLASLVDSSLHHEILDAVLSELSNDDKITFLTYLKDDAHLKIWQFLKKRVDKIEEKIKNAAEDLKRKLYQDIKEAKRKSL